KQALSARERTARIVGYAGTFLDGRIKSILNIEELLQALKNKETTQFTTEPVDVKSISSQPEQTFLELVKTRDKLIEYMKKIPKNNPEMLEKTKEDISKQAKAVADITSTQLRLKIAEAVNESDIFRDFFAHIAMGLDKKNLETTIETIKKNLTQKIATNALDPAVKESIAWWHKHVDSNVSFLLRGKEETQRVTNNLKKQEVISDAVITMATKAAISHVLNQANQSIEGGVDFNKLKDVLLFDTADPGKILERFKQLTELLGELEKKEVELLNFSDAFQPFGTVVKLAKDLALSPEILAVTGTPNSSKKLSDEEINKLASELSKGLSQPAAASDEEESSNAALSKKKLDEKIAKATQETNHENALNLWLQVREEIGNLASVSIPDYEKMEKLLELTQEEQMQDVITQEEQKKFLDEIDLFKQTIGPIKNLTTEALRLHVTNAFKGQAFDQFKKDMLGVLTTMAVNSTINLETLLSNKVFISKMKEISSKIISSTADESLKRFVACWNRHVEANLPVYAGQLTEKSNNPNVDNLTGADLENFLANAGAKELYLQEREKFNQKNQGQNIITPHREHIQPYVDTATTSDIAAEAMVTMMTKQIVDGEQEKMKSITSKIQKNTIHQLESLSKKLETEEKLVLEFWGVLESLKANVLASMLQTPTR
ncbi:MAG: hypothetical protein ACRC4G_00755, partial [Alphaproteobacteria bacterium]